MRWLIVLYTITNSILCVCVCVCVCVCACVRVRMRVRVCACARRGAGLIVLCTISTYCTLYKKPKKSGKVDTQRSELARGHLFWLDRLYYSLLNKRAMTKLTFFVMASTMLASIVIMCSGIIQARVDLFIPSVYLTFVSLLGTIMSAKQLDENKWKRKY